MGATEILEALQKKGEMTLSELSEETDKSKDCIKKILRRVLKDISENVEFRLLTPEEKEERYGKRIGTRIRIYSILTG